MKYLLDTNALIHFMNGQEPISSRITSSHPKDLAISGFTEAEIAFGIENSDPSTREKTRMARNLILAPFRRLYHDEAISAEYGKIKAHLQKNKIYHPKNEFDILIAATAIAKQLILVTQNKKDFEKIPNLQLEDWSKSP